MTIETVDRLSNLERLQFAYQNRILHAAWAQRVGAFLVIKNGRLYREQYETFGEYLLMEHGVAASKWKQWSASYQAHLQAQELDVVLANEYSGRAIRELDKSVTDLVIVGAQTNAKLRTGNKYEPIKALDIRTAAEELRRIVDEAALTGHVDIGDGTSTPIAAALDVALVERTHRKTEHAIAGAKKRNTKEKWSDPVRMYHFQLESYVCLDLPEPEDDATQIELKWRTVEAETEETSWAKHIAKPERTSPGAEETA